MTAAAPPARAPLRVALTLDLQPGKLEEYRALHDAIWPEVAAGLRAVGLRNLSLWAGGERLFYYAEYVGSQPFEAAMAQYAALPRVADWEALVHRYQRRLPGSQGALWWQPMQQVYHQD